MRFPYLREALSTRLADAPCSRIDRALGPELAESLDDIARIARAALPYIQKAAPGVLQGAVTGLLTGGPMGAVVGGATGGLSSLGVGASAPPATPGASTVAAAPGPSPAVSNPAALSLLGAILRPEVLEALIAMALGKQGASQVPIAGTNVPVAAVTNLIQSLAEQASAVHHPIARDTGIPAYLGEAVARGEDIARPHVRADAVHALIREAWGDDAGFDEEIDEEIDEEADGRDLADIYRLGST